MNPRLSALILLVCLLAGVGSVHGSPAANSWQADVDVVFNATGQIAEAPSDVQSAGSIASGDSADLIRHLDRTSLASRGSSGEACSRLYVLHQVFRL